MKRYVTTGIAIVWVTGMASSTHADVQTFFDFEEWSSALDDNFTTIDFIGFPDSTEITDQYANLGAAFPNFNVIQGPSSSFPNDGWGLRGFSADPPFPEVQPIAVEFSQPMSWVAANSPGSMQFQLLNGDDTIYESPSYGQLGNLFVGLVSNMTFDQVIISDVNDDVVFIDDLHFGPPIPVPGALGFFVIGALAVKHRRRRAA